MYIKLDTHTHTHTHTQTLLCHMESRGWQSALEIAQEQPLCFSNPDFLFWGQRKDWKCCAANLQSPWPTAAASLTALQGHGGSDQMAHLAGASRRLYTHSPRLLDTLNTAGNTERGYMWHVWSVRGAVCETQRNDIWLSHVRNKSWFGQTKRQFCHRLLILMSFKTVMTYFLLWNTREDVLKNINAMDTWMGIIKKHV